MKVMRLRQEELDLFSWLDPYNFLDRLELGNGFALVVSFEDEEEGVDIPVGLLVAGVTTKRITIEWLCISPEYRSMGAGEALLNEIFSIAAKKGKSEVAARFIDGGIFADVETRGEEWFKERSFDKELALPGACYINLRLIENNEFFKQGSKKLPKAMAFSKLLKGESAAALEKLINNPEAVKLYDFMDRTVSFDEEISSALFFENEPCGLLLAKRINDTCYPIFFYAESANEAAALAMKAVEGVKNSFPEDGHVRVIASGTKAAGYLKKVLPNDIISCRLLINDSFNKGNQI